MSDRTNDPDHSRQSTDPESPSPADSGRRRFMRGAGAGLAGMALSGSLLGAPGKAESPARGRYQGKVVLITGATSGIGEATARAYAAEGARVIFCGRREELGRQVEAAIRERGGEATYMRADVREEDQMEAFVARCLEVYGGLDIAFNNAGIAGPVGALDEIALEGQGSYQDVLRTNTHGVLYAMRHELPVMRKAGSGIIVNTASMLAHKGSSQAGAYAASKHAVIGLTRSAARRDAGNGIRVFSVSPGGTRTDLLKQFTGGDTLEGMGSDSPMGRLAEPEEIATVVTNLTVPENVFLNGDDVRADGASSA